MWLKIKRYKESPSPTGYVVLPESDLLQAIQKLERDGDEHGVAADFRQMLYAAPDIEDPWK